MRIAHINCIATLSTGGIAVALCRRAMREGHRALFCFSREYCPVDVPSYRIGSREKLPVLRSKLSTISHLARARFTDRSGFYSRHATLRLVEQLRRFKPDIIHLHNLHGYYLHVPTLFDYLKQDNVPVVWTLHDCWAFTGHCAYYMMAENAPAPETGRRRRAQATTQGCKRWMTGCGKCPLKRQYPQSFVLDQSARNWREKRAAFLGVEHMVLVTPSRWLQSQVKESFLKNYPVYALPNGIDLNVFAPCREEMFARDVLHRYKLDELGDAHLIVSAASVWEPRKGLLDLIELSRELGDSYAVVAVGLDEEQIRYLPPNTVIGLPRVNVAELCALYTVAELYVSASHEETMGLTLVEAMACGTQVLCYDTTAMPEMITPEVGEVAPTFDVKAMAYIARKMCDAPRSAAACRARAEEYDAQSRYLPYIDLYEKIYQHSPAYERDLRAGEERALRMQAEEEKRQEDARLREEALREAQASRQENR